MQDLGAAFDQPGTAAKKGKVKEKAKAAAQQKPGKQKKPKNESKAQAQPMTQQKLGAVKDAKKTEAGVPQLQSTVQADGNKRKAGQLVRPPHPRTFTEHLQRHEMWQACV